MAFTLSNKNITLQVEAPFEQYHFPRFDQTSKITSVHFQGISIAGKERPRDQDNAIHGRGFYSEFGIQAAPGFASTKVGDWFHKIGVGLLKKDGNTYNFLHPYAFEPASFSHETALEKLTTVCKSPMVNGIAYTLQKQIALQQNGFSIVSSLKNTGLKPIATAEYNHNFISLNRASLSHQYRLIFPFLLVPKKFDELINLERKVHFFKNEVHLEGQPEEPFFMSNLSANQQVEATWTLEHLAHQLTIREHLNHQTNHVNLWGWKHVISPELFHNINIKPGEAATWTRQYTIEKIYR